MRLMKKFLGAAAALALSASLLVGCGSSTASSAPVSAGSAAESTASSVEETAYSAADEEEAAAQLLNDLTGSYQELWPVILADEYKQTWLDDCAALVGEDNAEDAFEKLTAMITSDVYGEDAAKAYANGGGAYFCGFTNGLATLTVDGENSTISGTDKDGNVLFSYTYHYIGIEPERASFFVLDKRNRMSYSFLRVKSPQGDFSKNKKLEYPNLQRVKHGGVKEEK